MQAELTQEGRINEIISPSLTQLGYGLVKVSIIGDDKRKIVQILIDRIDGIKVGTDDCAKASLQVSAILDVEEPDLGKYNLELSSPGIDRPLTRLKDFETFKGLEAKIEVIDKIDDRRKFRGRLAGIKENIVIMDINIVSIDEPEEIQKVEIDFNNIKSAKLILNDELLSMHKSDDI